MPSTAAIDSVGVVHTGRASATSTPARCRVPLPAATTMPASRVRITA